MNNRRTAEKRRSGAGNSTGFTLIELLVVISIIAVIAAFLVPVAGAVRRHELIQKTQAEMAQLETALSSYKAAYGFYPPCNPDNPMINPLYYELMGTTNIVTSPKFLKYQSLDDPGVQIIGGGPGTPMFFAFHVSGFMNCSKPGAGEDAPKARSFLEDLKPDQVAKGFTNSMIHPPGVVLLVASVGGPDPNYRPLGASGVNPWRYVYPGTNNPNSYDLWVQLVFKPGQTNLICNWSRQVQINAPLP
ncbi:MAG: type II secretion system protein [Verrucomicrobiota bacterium]|nr:type II secretion system protein [Verrucomicrobiota bacterium]